MIIVLGNLEFFRKHEAIMKANMEKLTIFYKEDDSSIELRFVNYSLAYKTIIVKERVKELLTVLNLINNLNDSNDVNLLVDLFKFTKLSNVGEEVINFE